MNGTHRHSVRSLSSVGENSVALRCSLFNLDPLDDAANSRFTFSKCLDRLHNQDTQSLDFSILEQKRNIVVAFFVHVRSHNSK
jgi:hypothetical protein